MDAYIHGSTDAREVARLEKQAKFCSAWWLPHVEIPDTARVLDLGTGIGAMASELHARFPQAHITGLDRNLEQLAVARERHAVATYLHGDAASMPFQDATFDRVHASWVLEHVPSPLAVVREAHRVLVPDGVAYFLEVDNATFRTEPESAAITQLMDKLNAAQARASGDPFVGQRLGAIFEQAGFREVRATPLIHVADARDLTFFRAFVEEFAEIFESVDESMPELHELVTEACTDIRALPDQRGTAMYYTPVMVRAVR